MSRGYSMLRLIYNRIRYTLRFCRAHSLKVLCAYCLECSYMAGEALIRVFSFRMLYILLERISAKFYL